MRIGVLESEGYSSKAIDVYSKFAKIDFFKNGNIIDFIADKDVLVVRLKYKLDSKVLFCAKNLKFICSPTTGLNHIDLDYTSANKIEVISLKNEIAFLNTIRATPEHSFGLLLSLLRNYKKAFLNTENTNWDRNLYIGTELYAKKVAIVGLGRVGSLLANYCSAFGAKVKYFDIDAKKTSAVATRTPNLQQLLHNAEIVFLTVSYSRNNHQFFNAEMIDCLENCYFINTARAELLDEEYLLAKAKNNFFAGLAIDVIQDETNENNRLKDFLELTKKNNIIITPHIAGATWESMRRTEEFIADKLNQRLRSCI